MENLLVIIASVFVGAPLYVYNRCQRFFQVTEKGRTQTWDTD